MNIPTQYTNHVIWIQQYQAMNPFLSHILRDKKSIKSILS